MSLAEKIKVRIRQKRFGLVFYAMVGLSIAAILLLKEVNNKVGFV